jgi:hypothetical protein
MESAGFRDATAAAPELEAGGSDRRNRPSFTLGCGGGSINSGKRSNNPSDGGLWDVSAPGVGSFLYQ